ncbi:MAG: GDP-L-fucose synthase family protein [Bacteroidota bacterium]
MPKDARIYVAGHGGLVGSAIVRALQRQGFTTIITRTRQELDLRDPRAVRAFFDRERPEYVYVAAARVGGILANWNYPVEFLQDNLYIATNVISAAHASRVKKLLFLGSSCIYPRLAPQPMKEEYLFTGSLEPTNAPYAMAKLAGIELVRAYRREYGAHFISALPTNLYGPGDNFDLETSHVLAALIRKMHEAKVRGNNAVTVWGSGSPRREFLHVDDLADACVLLMESYDHDMPINVGTGEDLSIKDLAELVARVVGFTGRIEYDASRPDGMPRKLLDVTRLDALGWRPRIKLSQGIKATYDWFTSIGSRSSHV